MALSTGTISHGHCHLLHAGLASVSRHSTRSHRRSERSHSRRGTRTALRQNDDISRTGGKVRGKWWRLSHRGHRRTLAERGLQLRVHDFSHRRRCLSAFACEPTHERETREPSGRNRTAVAHFSRGRPCDVLLKQRRQRKQVSEASRRTSSTHQLLPLPDPLWFWLRPAPRPASQQASRLCRSCRLPAPS